MAFLANDAIRRVNLHSGIHALAQSGGFVFFVVYLVRSGVPVPMALGAMAVILAVRFMMRPAILPLARAWGIKPLLLLGTVAMAAQFPLLAEVRGTGAALARLCFVTALGEIFYWPTYNAYFAAIGDAEHRGHQMGVREALVSVAGILAPLLGGWALVALGPRPMFAAVAAIQVLAAIPLIGAPNVAVTDKAPGAFRAARLGVILSASDGWFDACFIFVWQIALFLSLGESFSAYGGAMALAGLAAAALGLTLGPRIDRGQARSTVAIAYASLASIVLLRAASIGSPAPAVIANALGALLGPLLMPQSAAIYNLAKASPCPTRFLIATEGGWDVGCASACLIAAALTASGVPLSLVSLVALPPLAVAAGLLRRYYAEGTDRPPLITL